MRSSGLLFLMLSACATVPAQPPEIPVSQVGVAFDRNGNVGSFSEGLADPAAGRAVTPDDPVRIASISKLVVGIGVMKLVEQGKLDLDEDVSRRLGWTLRNPAFPDRPITLRQLLSHTSSVRDFQDQYAIPLGDSVQATMAAPTSWDPKHGPSENFFTYSNLNFPIVASIVERTTGERFDLWMRREVIEPMKLDACYNWPTCSDAKVARAVVLTQGRQAGPRRSRRQASGLPGVRRQGPMRSRPLEARRERRSLRPSGRTADFDERPRPRRPDAP